MIVVLIWIMITAFFGIQLVDLKADFEFEKFFPTNDPDIAFYENHLQKFSYDNDYLIGVVENDLGVFDQIFLRKVQALTDSLQHIAGIDQVTSPTSAQQLVKGPMGITPLPILHVNDPDRYPSDSSKIFSHPIYKTFFARNGRSLLIQINHEHFTDPEKSTKLAEAVTTTFHQFDFDNFRLVGKLIAQETFVGYIQSDFVVFLGAALVLSFLLLTFIFRSVKIALLPYLISVTSLVWLLGLMSLLGYSISILGSLIPPVILFVASSDAIHLINAFRSSDESDFIKRLQKAVKKVFIPTLLTSVTTAIGFFSLLTIDTIPIQHLGIFAGLGILIAFVVTFAFSPLLINRNYPNQQKSTGLKCMAVMVLRHQKLVIGGWVILIALSIMGISMLKTDAYLLKDLPEDSQVRKDFNFVDQQFSGSKPWELAVWPADSNMTLLDEPVITELDKIDEYLREFYPMTRVLSPVTLIKYSNQMLSGGSNAYYQLPNAEQYGTTAKAVKRLQQKGMMPNVTNMDFSYGRFAGFIPEYGSHETTLKNKALLANVHQNVDTSMVSVRLTGTTYLIDKSHEVLSNNLLKGLLIGIGIISILLGLYFKSFKILLISIIPNIIPLLVVAGYMGLTGTPLQLTTSVIFAVAFGIAVDDTIHFLAVFQRSKAKSSIYKLIYTFQTAGKALIITTLIIVSGFLLFILSSFGATYYLGLFMTISLLIALLTDLTILPLLLHLFLKTRK